MDDINQCSQEYKDYVNRDNPVWQSIRQQVFERDNYTCVICGSQERRGMTCHHASGKYRFNESAGMHSLITLCDRCHTKYEKFMKRRDFLVENKGKRINPLIYQEFTQYIKDNQPFIDFYFSVCNARNCFK